DRVQDVSTKQSLVGRILKYGLVEVDAAGAQGAEKFDYCRSPELLRDQVFILSEQLRRGGRPTPRGRAPPLARGRPPPLTFRDGLGGPPPPPGPSYPPPQHTAETP